MRFSIQPVWILGRQADTAEVVGFSGLPPSYTLHLQTSRTTPALPAVPAIPAQGEPGDPNYVPAVPGVAEVPAVTTYETLHTITKDAFVTREQFDAWTDEPEEQIIPVWVAANHGLTLA